MLTVASCSHVTPLGPDPAATMPQPHPLRSPLVLEDMRMQQSAIGALPGLFIKLSGLAAGASARPARRPRSPPPGSPRSPRSSRRRLRDSSRRTHPVRILDYRPRCRRIGGDGSYPGCRGPGLIWGPRPGRLSRTGVAARSRHQRRRTDLAPRRLHDTVHRPGGRSVSGQQESSSPASAHTGRVRLKEAGDIMVHLGRPIGPRRCRRICLHDPPRLSSAQTLAEGRQRQARQGMAPDARRHRIPVLRS